MPSGGQHVGARQKIRQVDLPGRQQVSHGDFHQLDDLTAIDLQLRGKALAGAVDHVDVDLGDRAKTSPLDQDRPLPQHLGGLQHFAGRSEHGRAAQAQLHQLEAHHAIIDVAEFDARELDHVDFDALRGEVVEQRFEHQLRLVMQEKRGVKQIHADDAQRLLLKIVFAIQHADVDDDLAVVVPRVSLKFDAHPAMALVGALIVAGRHGVGEGEESSAVSPRGLQPLQIEAVFVVEHALQPLARDVALATAVDRIADGHVIGGHGFGNRAGRAADLEKPARDFLPGADFGKSAVEERIEIDLEGFLVCAQFRAVVAHICLSQVPGTVSMK